MEKTCFNLYDTTKEIVDKKICVTLLTDEIKCNNKYNLKIGVFVIYSINKANEKKQMIILKGLA